MSEFRKIAAVILFAGMAMLSTASFSSAAVPGPCPGDPYQCAGIVVGTEPSYGVGSGIGYPKPDPCERFIEFC